MGLALLAALTLAACAQEAADTNRVDVPASGNELGGGAPSVIPQDAAARSPGALAFSATDAPAYRLQPFRAYGFSGVDMLSVGAGDFTGDGRADAVFSQKWASLYYIIQKDGDLFNGYEGYGFFAYEWHAYNELVIADFDRNGYPEAAAPVEAARFRSGDRLHPRRGWPRPRGLDAPFAAGGSGSIVRLERDGLRR